MLKIITLWMIALCISADAQTVPAVGSKAPAAFFAAGGLQDAGGTPVISSCGTSPSVNGKDMRGIVTVGGGVVTSCTLTFSAAKAAAPICIISTNSATVAGGVTTTTAALVVALSETLGDGKIHYICALP